MEVKKSPKADLSKSSTMFFEIGLIAALAIVLIAFEWRSKEIKKAELSANDIIAAEEEIIPITEEENVVRPKMPTIPILSDAIEIVENGKRPANNTSTYDLSGRKVAPASLKKGVYISNGKKIIVR